MVFRRAMFVLYVIRQLNLWATCSWGVSSKFGQRFYDWCSCRRSFRLLIKISPCGGSTVVHAWISLLDWFSIRCCCLSPGYCGKRGTAGSSNEPRLRRKLSYRRCSRKSRIGCWGEGGCLRQCRLCWIVGRSIGFIYNRFTICWVSRVCVSYQVRSRRVP